MVGLVGRWRKSGRSPRSGDGGSLPFTHGLCPNKDIASAARITGSPDNCGNTKPVHLTHLTDEQIQEIADRVLLELATQFGQHSFWKPLADEIQMKVWLRTVNRGGPAKPTTPTSGNT